MKKFTIILMLICFFLSSNQMVLATVSIEKPRVNVVNRAVKNGDIERVKRYIDAGFNPNETYFGASLICTAIQRKQNEIVDVLLVNGTSANPSKTLVQPLYYAVVKNNPYAVKRLLENGAEQDKTFMGITAEHLALSKNYENIINEFDNYNNSKSDIAKLNNAKNTLKNNPIGKTFYEILNGNNPMQQPFVIKYAHLSQFTKKHESYLAMTRIYNGKIYIYLNSNLKNSSPEALATLIASQCIHTDTLDSLNEEMYSAMLQGTLWEFYIKKNPKLKDENSILIQTLNYYTSILEENNYDINAFKNEIAKNFAYKNLPKSSKGFSDKDIGIIPDQTFIEKTKKNIKAEWQKTTTAEKLIYLGAFVASFAISYYASSVYFNNATTNSTFTTIRINSF